MNGNCLPVDGISGKCIQSGLCVSSKTLKWAAKGLRYIISFDYKMFDNPLATYDNGYGNTCL